MSRNYGLLTLPSNFEVQYQGPLDARTIVPTFAELISGDAFKSTDGIDYSYKGIIVTVTDDETTAEGFSAGYLNGTYVLLDDDYTLEENWGRLVTTSVDGLVDYRTGVTNYATINGVAIDGDMVTEDFGFTFLTAQVVDELLPIDEAKVNVVYFAPDPDTEATEYEEYMIKDVDTDIASQEDYDTAYPDGVEGQCYVAQYVDEFTGETMGPYLRTYELIGRAELDLSGYYTKEETDLLVTYFDKDENGDVIEEALDPETYNLTEDAKESYVTVGSIPSGTVMNGTQMQDLIEELFFAVVDVTITEPTVTITFDPTEAVLTASGETMKVKPTVEIDYGKIVLGDLDLGNYAGDTSTLTYTVGGVTAELDDDGYLSVETSAGTDVVVEATLVLADGQTFTKSDGSASDFSSYTSDTYTGSMTVTAIGTAYDCAGGTETATAVLNEKIDSVNGYILCEVTATEDQVVKVATSFGDVLGIQMLNGFTRDYEYIGGSAAASLELYTVETVDDFNVITYVGVTAGARIIRVVVGTVEAEGETT